MNTTLCAHSPKSASFRRPSFSNSRLWVVCAATVAFNRNATKRTQVHAQQLQRRPSKQLRLHSLCALHVSVHCSLRVQERKPLQQLARVDADHSLRQRPEARHQRRNVAALGGCAHVEGSVVCALMHTLHRRECHSQQRAVAADVCARVFCSRRSTSN